MSVWTSKWIIFLMAIIALLLFLYLLGKESVHSELIIEANPQQIWEVLMEEERYKEWNHVLIPIEGKIKKGNNLRYKLVQPGDNVIEIGMEVVEILPHQLLNQYGGLPGVFTYDHRYILEPFEDKTRMIIHEDFRGIGVVFMDLSWIEHAYMDLNKSLRKYVLTMTKNLN